MVGSEPVSYLQVWPKIWPRHYREQIQLVIKARLGYKSSALTARLNCPSFILASFHWLPSPRKTSENVNSPPFNRWAKGNACFIFWKFTNSSGRLLSTEIPFGRQFTPKRYHCHKAYNIQRFTTGIFSKTDLNKTPIIGVHRPASCSIQRPIE